MNAATFMGKSFQDNRNSIVNTTDLTLKKMFDISSKLVGDQDDQQFGQIQWERIHGNICHLLVMKPLSIFNAQKFSFSHILCCVLEGSIRSS